MKMEEPMTRKQQSDVKLKGIGISPGVAIGTSYIYRDILQRGFEYYSISEAEAGEEWMRIEDAVYQVSEDLKRTADKVEERMNNDSSKIFLAQEAMLRDPTLTEDLKKTLRTELVNAEHVVKQVFLRWERKFLQLHREKIRQQGDDIADLARRLLLILEGIHAHTLENIPEGSVLVARRLLPSDTVFLSRNSTAAVAVEHGGRVSHAAILTRELGVPGVAQIPDLLDHIKPGDVVFVDGDHGEIAVRPNEESKKALSAIVERRSQKTERAKARCRAPALTPYGLQVTVLANVSCKEDVEHAAENGADGIGLYRTEQIYLSRQSPPSERRITESLSNALSAAKGTPISLRLLDAGGDKSVPFLNVTPEQNPFLGKRGIRLLLDHPDLLETQLRAFLRLSDEYDVRILVPMVTVAEDMQKTREMMMAATTEMHRSKPVPLGAMIETPAAALCVSEIIKYADFLSVGTNDLTQYTMAAGRENSQVSDYFVDDHAAIMRLLKIVATEANDRPVSICGELAGRADSLPELLQLGITTFSVAPPLIPEVKEHIREL
jgi:phosphotransferase system enzyme I (PtsI)